MRTRRIGTIRREYLDRIFFWNPLDLEQKLAEFRFGAQLSPNSSLPLTIVRDRAASDDPPEHRAVVDARLLEPNLHVADGLARQVGDVPLPGY